MADNGTNRGIQFEVCDYATTCDGCGQEIGKGSRYLNGIDSCCGGGCCRCLCMNCVGWIAENAQEGAPT